MAGVCCGVRSVTLIACVLVRDTRTMVFRPDVTYPRGYVVQAKRLRSDAKEPGDLLPGLLVLRFDFLAAVRYGATMIIWFCVSAPVVIVRPPASKAALKPDAAGGVARST